MNVSIITCWNLTACPTNTIVRVVFINRVAASMLGQQFSLDCSVDKAAATLEQQLQGVPCQIVGK